MVVFIWLTAFGFALCLVQLTFSMEVSHFYQVSIPLGAIGLAFVCLGGLIGAIFGRSRAAALAAAVIYIFLLFIYVPWLYMIAQA